MYTNIFRRITKKILLIALSFVFIFSSIIQSSAADDNWSATGSPVIFGNGGLEYVNPMITSGITNVAEVYGGNFSSTQGVALFRKNDGTLWSAGANEFGQAGVGDTSTFSTAAQVIGLTNVTHATSTGITSYAISSGNVYSWGSNRSGALGYASAGNQLTPQQIPGLSNITKIEAGQGHVVALRNDGTVFTWGLGDDGQIGNGSTSDVTLPVSLGLTGITDIEAVGSSSFARNSSSQVYSWGNNDNNILGHSDTATPVDSNVPQLSLITGITEFTDNSNISAFAGGGFIFGKTASGLIKFNGVSSSGILVGAWNNSPAYVSCSGAVSYVNCDTLITANSQASFGSSHLLQLTPANTVFVSGNGFGGATSDGTYPNTFSPIDITGQIGGTVADVTVSGVSNYITLTDGTVRVWGPNQLAQLGENSTPKSVPGTAPEPINNAGNWTDIVFGNVAIDPAQEAYFWGGNVFGGNGVAATPTFETTPVQVPGINNVVEINTVGGGYHARRSDGTVFVWGRNNASWLALGTSSISETPQANANFPANIIEMDGHCYIDATNAMSCWGWNVYGQVGDGTNITRTTPVPIDTNVVDVSGGSNLLYVKGDGTVWSSGHSATGCLGFGDTENDVATPAQITGLSNITDVDDCVALDGNGDVFRWGRGPVGDGTDQERLTPVPISFPEDITEVSERYAIGTSGTVYAYSSAESLTPVAIDNISNGQRISQLGYYIFGDVLDPLTTPDLPAQSFSCDDAVESQTTTCTFTLPATASLPIDFKLSVGNATPGGACSVGASNLVTCITVPVGSDQNAALDPESQDVFGAIGNDAPVDTGEDANVFSVGGDADGDGITNGDELTNTGTDPFNADTDGDGLPDGWENDNGLDPLDSTGDNGANGDPDGDGLLNSGEYLTQFDPNDADSDSMYTAGTDENDNTTNDCDEDIDGDNISNCDEIANGLDPLFANTDTDGDGIPDEWEIANGLDPNNPNDAGLDPDGDGATNLQEYTLGTDPNDADSDSIRTPGVDENDNTVNDCDEDFDNDGLSNCGEFAAGSDPFNSDTDGDGLPDGYEVDNGLDPTSATGDNGPDGDPDGDGLLNRDEFALGFNANNRDSDSTLTAANEAGNGTSDCDEDNDGDGATNCDEIAAGTDPLDPNSTPAVVTTPTTTPRTGGAVLAGLSVVASLVGIGFISQKRKKPHTKIS